jgi:hypothetical protein
MSRSARGCVRAWAACAVPLGIGLAVVTLAGCAQPRAASRAGSEQACVQFGVSALTRHVTVTAVPAACRDLTGAEINTAVARALGTVAGSTAGKAARRARATSLSPLLAGLIQAVPAPAAAPVPVTEPALAAAGDPETFGIPALLAWLLTVGLGTTMIRRRILRLLSRGRAATGALARDGVARDGVARDGVARDGRLAPAVIVGHAGLAVAGLLAWAAYLIAGWTEAGWAGCVTLVLVISLGIALLSLRFPERGQARQPSAVLAGAHGVLAVTTIALVLAALGSG